MSYLLMLRSQKVDVLWHVSCMGSKYQVKEFGNLPNNSQHNYLVYNNAIGGIQKFPFFSNKTRPILSVLATMQQLFFLNTSHIDLKRIDEGLGAEMCLDFTLLVGFLHLIYVLFSMIKAVVRDCLIIAHLLALQTGDVIENWQDMLFIHKKYIFA